ncbi:MAG: tetratricopeptide repeat protein [Planctomycetes bacterium]|nr:tetratricopeptide repeat protein [Planctomycetota bacterium]
MTDESEGRDLETAFDDAIELRLDERDVFVASIAARRPELGARLRQLLAAHDRMGMFLEEPAPLGAPATPPRASTSLSGTTIGAFRLGPILGEGGFGTVYEAEQLAPVRRTVALKILKAGLDTDLVVARFAAERQTLALMNHPNIARVFEAGATEAGRPYFVMEKVPGVPLTRYCNRQKLSIADRLGLFRDVCAAVQHAHQKGVIHRDLKPSNILVTADDGGTAKVIDFGIAKATSPDGTDSTELTRQNQFLGTPAYMSPEQLTPGGSVDTRSDVYSLGVVLYELLTGETPAVIEGLRGSSRNSPHAREDLPRPSTRLGGESGSGGRPREGIARVAADRSTDPTTLVRALRHDLDWIVMKSIASDPTQRYASADALSDDLRRYLEGEPVEARPPHPLYRWRKLVGRHRVAFIAGSLFLGLLIISVAGLTWLAIELDRQRRRAVDAEQRADDERGDAVDARDESEAVSAFLSEMFANLSPFREGYDVRVREVLDTAAEQLEKSFASRPRLRSRLRHTIGDSYREIGLFEPAAAHLTRAIEERTQCLGGDHTETRASRRLLAATLRSSGKLREADTILDALQRDESRIDVPRREALATLRERGVTWYEQGRYVEARAALEECREQAERWGFSDALWTLDLGLGRVAERSGDLATAERYLARVVDAAGDNDESEEALSAEADLAMLLLRRGRVDESRLRMQEILDRRTARFGPEHVATLNARANLATLHAQTGAAREAEGELLEVLEIAERTLGDESLHLDRYRVYLCGARVRLGRWDAAEPVIRQVVENYSARFGPNNPRTLEERHRLAMTLQRLDRADEAETMLRAVLADTEEHLGPMHPTALKIHMSLGLLDREQGRPADAERECLTAIDGLSRTLGPENSATLGARTNLGRLYLDQGRFDEAESMLRSTLEIKRRVLGPTAPFTRSCLYNLGLVYLESDRPERAIEIFEEYVELQSEALGASHASTQRGRALLDRARSAVK